MAIKGKKRSKGGRARVAAPPRPVMVTPKKPLTRRLWFRSLLVAVLLGAIGTGGFFAWQERQAAAELEAAREDVARVGVAMENALLGVGQQIPGGDYVILPELGQTVSEIQIGEYRERRILRSVDEWTDAIEDADGNLAAIESERAQVRQAIARMREGLGQYLAVIAEVPDVLETSDEEERQEAAADLQFRLQEAAGTFSGGWLIYQNLRAEVGLDDPAADMEPQVPPGFDPNIPPGFDPNMPGFDPTELPEGFDPEQLPEGIEFDEPAEG